MSNKEDNELKKYIKEMFPEGTDEQFINNMFHSLRGKQMLWDCFGVNDGKNLTKKFTD
jgi:hypothetical protein|tara:strand:- start:1159 stop:1332 length:174 start_codon:yes stop_codon:yes gene_type:complete